MKKGLEVEAQCRIHNYYAWERGLNPAKWNGRRGCVRLILLDRLDKSRMQSIAADADGNIVEINGRKITPKDNTAPTPIVIAKPETGLTKAQVVFTSQAERPEAPVVKLRDIPQKQEDPVVAIPEPSLIDTPLDFENIKPFPNGRTKSERENGKGRREHIDADALIQEYHKVAGINTRAYQVPFHKRRTRG